MTLQVVNCPEDDGAQIIETMHVDQDHRFAGWHTYHLACGHDLVVEMQWCRDCKSLRDVEERDPQAFAGPDRTDGSGPIMDVAYLSCGHQTSRDTSDRSSVL